MNLEFFERLYDDQSFCEAVGRMVLAASQLESSLRVFLGLFGQDGRETKATLGRLTQLLDDAGLLTQDGKRVFDDMTLKRNYLTHNLHALFADRIEETILPRTDLWESDVDYFTERAATGLATEVLR